MWHTKLFFVPSKSMCKKLTWSYILKQTWCLSVYVFVTNTRPLDLLAARNNSSLICGLRWLCERRIRAMPGIWVRGQKKQHSISHTRTHVRMHMRFLHPMLCLRTHTRTHPQRRKGRHWRWLAFFLPKPVFTHGQLYVAMSCIGWPKGVKLLVTNGWEDAHEDAPVGVYTRNVVYTEVL